MASFNPCRCPSAFLTNAGPSFPTSGFPSRLSSWRKVVKFRNTRMLCWVAAYFNLHLTTQHNNSFQRSKQFLRWHNFRAVITAIKFGCEFRRESFSLFFPHNQQQPHHHDNTYIDQPITRTHCTKQIQQILTSNKISHSKFHFKVTLRDFINIIIPSFHT